jgi:pimeloyl-ACP methyl ester carboxylesterase
MLRFSSAGAGCAGGTKQIEVGGVRVAFERVGEGPAVVLLHGVLGASGMWRRQLDELCDEFTLVAWDAPGCGRSSDPLVSFRLPEYADCLAAFIAALGVGRPHVVGLGWFGAGLAMELYRRHPTLPRTLVLSGAYPGWADSMPADVVARRLESCRREPGYPSERLARRWTAELRVEAESAEVADDVAASRSVADQAGSRLVARSFAEATFGDSPRIDVPTLLLCAVPNPARIRPVNVDSRIGAVRILDLPGVGHPSSSEAPDRFAAAVLGFLRSPS